MSNAVAAVLGIANNGPIDKYNNTKYVVENNGEIFSSISAPYPFGLSVPTISVTIAIPTPDTTNPKIAGQKFPPELTPSAGGKIKFPAPKKIPNNNNPVNKPFFIYNISFLNLYSISIILYLSKKGKHFFKNN